MDFLEDQVAEEDDVWSTSRRYEKYSNAASSPLQDHYLCTVDFEYIGLLAVDPSSIIQFELYARIFEQKQTSYSIRQ